MHIPDGVLPLWIVIAGWMATALILYFCISRVKRVDVRRKIPLIGIVSALMIVGMTLEIVPIAYHVNLSIIAGILLGPSLAFIAVFIVNLIIAMFGHGGITVVGLNTLVVGAEAVLGFYIFLMFRALISKDSPGWISALAVIVSLFLSTCIMLGIVYISHAEPPKSIKVSNETVNTESESVETSITEKKLNFGRFAKTVFILAPLGWVLEAAVTGLAVGYIARIRPDLILPEAT